MFIGFKDRTFSLNDKVKVHRNLNNGLWSLTATTGEHKGKVIYHCAQISLSNVVFKVSAAGRNRVLQEGRKNVHAWCIGTLQSLSEPEGFSYQTAKQVTYDPYKYGFFYQENNENVTFDTLNEIHFVGTKAYTA